MVKTWSEDNPKAGLMAHKRALIVEAAQQAFLENGYSESSVNRIAAQAGVSIKTLYRHFQSKDELFSAVMQATCASFSTGPDGKFTEPGWFMQPPETGLVIAGMEFLKHEFSEQQLGLCRVLTRDAIRFPELARRYSDDVVDVRNRIFAAYLDKWQPLMKWTVQDKMKASETFGALLKAGLFQEALYAVKTPDTQTLERRAQDASHQLSCLLHAGLL